MYVKKILVSACITCNKLESIVVMYFGKLGIVKNMASDQGFLKYGSDSCSKPAECYDKLQ